MAGRDISTRHDALGAVRVMRTCGCMGEIVGMAASLCKRYDGMPRDVYQRYLSDLQDLMRRGAGKTPAAEFPLPRPKAASVPVAAAPAWLATAGPNLARAAEVSAPTGSKDGCAPALINDGQADVSDNAARWLSSGKTPHAIEFTWKEPVTVGAARIVSGYSVGTVSEPIADFVFQSHDGTQWRDIPGAAAQGNRDPYWNCTFAPVKTARLRLWITKTKIDISRIWEVELYGPVTDR